MPAKPAGFRNRGVREAAVLTVGLTILCYLVFVGSPLADGHRIPAITYILYAISVLPGLALLPGLFALVRAVEAWPRLAQVAVITPAACALALLHAYLDTTFVGLFVDAIQPGRPNPVSVGGSAMIYVWVYGLFAAVVGLMLSNLAIQHRERLLAEARDAAHQAQLAALRFQLNPHFLFNTLNAISSLIVTRRNDEAEAMMEKLSDFLRATLQSDPHGHVTLEEEFDTLTAYLNIERVRFGERLAVEIDCPPALGEALVPGFVLQPLVENAIKYAVAPSRAPVTIRIAAEARDGDLALKVEDEGALVRLPPKGGAGVGVANVRARLSVLYGERGVLLAGPQDRGFGCLVRMPLELRARAEAAA
jgi:signal transduction histidine kinase